MAQPYGSLLIIAIFVVVWPFTSGLKGLCTSFSQVSGNVSYTVEPIPGQPAHFAFCSNTFQITLQCFQNHVFDPVTLKCVPKSSFKYTVEHEVPENSPKAFPGFEQCDHFKKLSKLQCSNSGAHFDVLQRRCVPKWELTYESQCNEQTTIDLRSLRLTLSANKTDDEVEICSPVGSPCGGSQGTFDECVCDPKTCPKEGYVTDWENCRLFYQCEANGFKHHRECPSGTIFNPGLVPPACVNEDFDGHVECRDDPKPTTPKPTVIPITPTTPRSNPTATVPDLTPEPSRTTVMSSTPTAAPSSEPTWPSTVPPSQPATLTTAPSTKPTERPTGPTITTKPSVPPPTTSSPSLTSKKPTVPTSTTTTTPSTEKPGGGRNNNFILYFLVFFLAGLLVMILILIIFWKWKQKLRNQERIQFEAFHY